MPTRASKSTALNGNVADQSPVAILLIDVINSFDFPGSELLIKASLPMSREIAALCRKARQRKIPVIYANDNFGRWRSNLDDIVIACISGRGRRVVEKLRPQRKDYFVLKPKNSAFYTTTLDLLLHHIGVKKLFLVGILADNCVLFSANDAYMRDYQVIVPSDCVASIEVHHKTLALEHMHRVLKADIRPWREALQSIL